MNCSEAKEKLSAYYDGELDGDQSSRLAEHLAQCTDCSEELAGFKRLSNMATSLSSPPEPQLVWGQLQQRLDEPSELDDAKVTPSTSTHRSALLSRSILLALAATLLVATGVGWFSYRTWFGHGEHDHFTQDFGEYLTQFSSDPEAAQQLLLTKYEHELVDANEAMTHVGYRPAVAGGLPSGYRLKSTHVMKMPCCTCVQSLCQRSDGTSLAIFEHDDEETTEWFGDRPETVATCGNKQCSLVELDSDLAASWKRGARHITLVGARGKDEVSDIVAWFDGQRSAAPD